MLIVDTSVWIDFFADRDTREVQILDRAIDDESVGVGDLMLCEVLQGIRHDAQFREVRDKLLRLHVVRVVDMDIALKAAENYRSLRRRGITVRKTIDALIATFCIEKGHVLLHNDRDFDPFEEHLGLQVAP